VAKRILILTADAGFGHRRAAEAVEAAFKELYGDKCDTTIANPMQAPDAPSIMRRLEGGYDSVVTEEPTFYALAYYAIGAPIVADLVQTVTSSLLNDALESLVLKYKPDAIAMTYPAYAKSAVNALEKTGRRVPLCVIVTDLVDVHPLWFSPEVDCTFVPTGAIHRQAVDSGVPADRVKITGLPVHPIFAREPRDLPVIRESLGWDPEMTTALIVGSARTRQVVDIARLLDQSGLPLQMAIVSGGDEEAERHLRAQRWRGVVHVYGLVDNMPEMIRAADFVISKAGGVIVSESLACGRPLALYEALPGQEVGNVRYVTTNGAGEWSPGPIGVLATIYSWLAGDGENLKRFQAAAKRVGKPRASYDIAERIYRMIDSGEVPPRSGSPDQEDNVTQEESQ
jgi:1,2-diacylglycerol 3-beta-galactosyltransferase